MLRDRIEELTEQLASLHAVPTEREGEETALANRVLEAVDLPMLPTGPSASHPLVRQGASSATASAPDPAAPPPVQLEPDISGLQYSPDDLLGGGWNDSTSFADLSQLCWDDNTTLDWPWMDVFAPQAEVPLINGDSGNEPPNEANITAEDAEEDEVDQDLVNEIAARAGTLRVASDGKLRYFGSPSNVHLLSNTTPGPHSKPRSLSDEGERHLRIAGLDQTVNPDIEKHILNLFFSWYNSCHPVMERSFYWMKRERYERDGEYDGFYSTVLTNAM